jgi:hypothetical protein
VFAALHESAAARRREIIFVRGHPVIEVHPLWLALGEVGGCFPQAAVSTSSVLWMAPSRPSLNQLWKINFDSAFSARPMTFEVNGKQYVAIASGTASGKRGRADYKRAARRRDLGLKQNRALGTGNGRAGHGPSLWPPRGSWPPGALALYAMTGVQRASPGSQSTHAPQPEDRGTYRQTCRSPGPPYWESSAQPRLSICLPLIGSRGGLVVGFG